MLQKSYVVFYLEGRDAKLFKDSTDDKELAQRVADGAVDIRAAALEAATAAAKPFATGRSRTRWLHDHTDEIIAAGGDTAVAYDHYTLGRVHALAYSLEADILAELGDLEGMTNVDVDDDDEDSDPDEEPS